MTPTSNNINTQAWVTYDQKYRMGEVGAYKLVIKLDGLYQHEN